MSRARIGFVGVGAMGQCAHLKNYVTLPDCEVAALAEIREDVGRKVAARYGVPKSYSGYEEMLDSEQLDGIVASQPFTRHGVLITGLLRARVPLFIEKPLAGSVEVGERILEALAQSGTWIMVGYHKRSDPATIYAKEAIDQLKQTGELGSMRYVRLVMPPGDWIAGGFRNLIKGDSPVPELEFDPPASDMDAPTYAKYTAFVNYYIHQVNLMRHLLGESYKVIYADQSEVLLAVRSESGVAGVIEMSPYRTTVDWHESALIAFEHGYVKIDLPAPLVCNRPGRVEIFRDPGSGALPELTVPILPPIHAMRQQAINFVKAVRGEMKPPCEAGEAMEDLIVAREYIRLLRGC